MDDLHLLVGLGNPGRRYRDTRHNAGFLVLDELARRWSIRPGAERGGVIAVRGEVAGAPCVLAWPQTYMNRSGGPVGRLAAWYRVPTSRIVVVHDDLDLPPGAVRIKRGGGHGGHNGLRDLERHLPDRNTIRVRLGIGRPPPGWDPADYVLGRWSEEERAHLDEQVARGADAVEAILQKGVTAAMDSFNVRPRRRRGRDPAASGDPDSSLMQHCMAALGAAGA